MRPGEALVLPRCDGAERSWRRSKYCRAHRALGRIATAPFLVRQCRREHGAPSLFPRLGLMARFRPSAVGQAILRLDFVLGEQPFAKATAINDKTAPMSLSRSISMPRRTTRPRREFESTSMLRSTLLVGFGRADQVRTYYSG